MKTNYIEINEAHTWQASGDKVYIGCSAYDTFLNSKVEIMLVIPAQLYLEDIAGELKNIVKGSYKTYLDKL